MKKLLIALVALLGTCSVAFAGANDITQTGTIGISVGTVWGMVVDGYEVTHDNDTSTPDIWVARGMNLTFGTISMLSSGIFSTLTSSTDVVNEAYDVPHRAGDKYMDIRVYVDNNLYPMQVGFTITGFPILNLTPPSANGYTQTSVMHIGTGILTAAMNAGAVTTYPANLRYRVDNAADQAAKTAAQGQIVNGTQLIVYTSGTAIVSDAFNTYVSVDYLPLTVPSANYNQGTVTWRLIQN